MQAAADLATQRGHAISKSHISKNARLVETVTPQLIHGIAAGYDIPPEDVARAVLADLGFAIGDYNPSPESAIRRDPHLSSEARGILLAAIDAARGGVAASGGVVGQNEPEDHGIPASMLPTGYKARVVRTPRNNRRHQSGSG